MKQINFKLLAGVLIVSLAVFFLGNYLLNNYRLNSNLTEQLIEIDGIEEVEINQNNAQYRLEILLDQEVEDLQLTFNQLKDQVDDTFEDREYEIEVKADSNEVLEQTGKVADLALHEAITTGEFVKLAERVEDYKEEYELEEAIVQVDNDHIYLTLTEDEAVLYKVVEREQKND
ncbi:hypothetical protein MWH28_08620 [Natroniella sulfidigena]|uniref:hypothetical protein n=1 Tax=Natroniella sulfidigena TaxID=723921 RepID=UPI00200A46BA|nr:hypothetical protein [Natroniella sulfidigena]MCK8817420.1 hypothetical protein [Natroniella sulfidigena]